MNIGDDMIEDLTEEEWDQIRALVDKLQMLLEEQQCPRFMVAAAFGVCMGEQYPTQKGLTDAINLVCEWALISYTQGVKLSEGEER